MVQPPPIESQNDPADATDLVAACEKIREQVGRVVVGQDAVIEQLLIAILARGHCLLEGVPGLAKTLKEQLNKQINTNRSNNKRELS